MVYDYVVLFINGKSSPKQSGLN